MRTSIVALVVLAALSGSAAGADYRLKPYKDDLFKYQRILGEAYGGEFVVVEFLPSRDIDGRDEVPLKKAFDKFVSLDVNEKKKDLTIGSGRDIIRYMGVGRTDGDAKMVVIFLHGGHGDRSLAMEDLRFGGNFNRLKNLMALNDGVYLTPDFSDFGRRGTSEVTALIKHYAANSPGAPIVVGCASTGCKVVYRLLEDPETARLLGGVVLLGALPLGTQNESTFFSISIFTDPTKRVPVYIGQGSNDKTASWVTQELLFKKIKKLVPHYPIRFELFKSDAAVHGTPLRMVDWRLVLNWILSVRNAT